MNSFANSLFNLLMGWFKTLARSVWDHLSDLGNTVKGLGENWVAAAVVLLLLGIAVDRAVWFFRWRPDKVWRTRLRKLYHRRNPEPELPVEGYLDPVGEVANRAEENARPAWGTALREESLPEESVPEHTAVMTTQPPEEHRHVRTHRRSERWENNPDFQDD